MIAPKDVMDWLVAKPSEVHGMKRRELIVGSIAALGGGTLSKSANVSVSDLKVESPTLSKHEFTITSVANGFETVARLDFKGANGVTGKTQSFLRFMDMGESYTVVLHSALQWYSAGSLSPGAEAVYAAVHNFTKGEIIGDHRNDRMDTTYLTANGSIVQFPPTIVSVKIRSGPQIVPTDEEIAQVMAHCSCTGGSPTNVPSGLINR